MAQMMNNKPYQRNAKKYKGQILNSELSVLIHYKITTPFTAVTCRFPA